MVLCGEESIENVSEWRVVNRNREIGNFSTSLRLPFTPSLQVVKCTEEKNLQGHFYFMTVRFKIQIGKSDPQ